MWEVLGDLGGVNSLVYVGGLVFDLSGVREPVDWKVCLLHA